MFSSMLGVAGEVGSYWQNRAYSYLTSKSPQNQLLSSLATAATYEEWEAIALQLDSFLGYDLWRQNASSAHYDYRLIYERQQAIIAAHEDEDVLGLVGLLRSGLVRNLGNITAPGLYNRAYAGTKLLIEDYISQVSLAIEHLAALPAGGEDGRYASGWTAQSKLDLLHDTRQAFGRSTLVLQGGAIFGLCHLGVVKALHLRGLLPRIITGTATGALIAALVGTCTEEELLDFLDGDAVDFTSYRAGGPKSMEDSSIPEPSTWNNPKAFVETISQRTVRYLKEGFLLDIRVLETCVEANVGDMTFLEAYARTKRVLNITIATSGRSGVPNLLNYLTAPNVLIYSATLVSNAVSAAEDAPVILKCKDEEGNVVPWSDFPAAPSTESQSTPSAASPAGRDHDAPLARIASLFNVNHFIVSQARPHIAPFLSPSEQHQPPSPHSSTPSFLAPVIRLLTGEVNHRLTQLDELGFLPPAVRKLLLDESIPMGSSITLVPTIGASDYLRLLDQPSKEEVSYWIQRGERSVWPAISALRIRCAVEVELDRGYQLVRRRKPLDGDFGLAKSGHQDTR